MIALNESQSEALAELINIAFGLTAANLSEISGHRIRLEPPTISSHPIDDLADRLAEFEPGELVFVRQGFKGPFSGDAILCVNSEGAVGLSSILLAGHRDSLQLDSSGAEILAEIGNMLLSSCLGVFSNLLQLQVSISVRELHQGLLRQFLDSLKIADGDLRHAVVIDSSFKISESGTVGRIGIIINVSSLERLIQAVDKWEGNTIHAK
jgi:chemotaxis protein CheC